MVFASKIAWGDRLPVTLSLSCTVVSRGDTEDAMVVRAERALQQSVGQGGNRFTVNNR
jgi:hypothetical protein